MQRFKVALGVLVIAVSFSALMPLERFIDGPPRHIKLLPAKQSARAPDFTLPELTTTNTIRLLEEVKAHPVVFSFWATYCEPCADELPKLDRIEKRYQGRVAFFGINSDDTPAAIQAYARRHKLGLRMLSDTARQAETRYSVDAFPRLFVVDTHGIVRAVLEGDSPILEADLPAILDSLLRETPPSERATNTGRAGNT